MDSIERLFFYRRIPLRIENEHVIGCREVETGATRLERDEKDGNVVIGLEAIHDRGAVPSRSIEPDVLEAPRCHVRLEQIEHRRPLREHERFMLFEIRNPSEKAGIEKVQLAPQVDKQSMTRSGARTGWY